MPSDLRNSTKAKATGLVFSLFDVASAREVPFAILLYIQHILHGLSTAFLCVPFILVHNEKCRFSGRYMMASIKLSIIFIVATLITTLLLLVNPCILHRNNRTVHPAYIFIVWKEDASLPAMFNPLCSRTNQQLFKKNFLCHYIVYFNHFNNRNHISVAIGRDRGPVKDLIEQLVTKAHRIIVKKVVYDEFMK